MTIVICDMHDATKSCTTQNQGKIHLGKRRED